MDDQDLTLTIEAYLDNTLPQEKRQEIEQRIATDTAFRQEVQLHRHLREHWSNPKRWKHLSALSEIIKEPILEDNIDAHHSIIRFSYRQWMWFGLLALIILGLIYWLWIKPTSPRTPLKEPDPSPSRIIADMVPKDTNPNQPNTFDKQPEILPSQSKDRNLYASKIAADFAINESLERRISGTRSPDMSISSILPIENTDFPLARGNKTAVRFKGDIEQTIENSTLTLSLSIFNNKDSRTPIQFAIIKTSRDTLGSLSFNHTQLLPSKRGLYYFIFKNEKGELLVGGKFTIGDD